MDLQAFLRRLAGTTLKAQRLGMGKLGMGKPGLRGLKGSLRILQRASGDAMRGPLRFQRRFQLSDARLETCCRIVVAPAVQDNHRNSAILHEAVARTHLVGPLLRRLARRALQAQGATHATFGRLGVAG